MKERPILFSGAMVRAILAGRKTQTRRVLTPQPTVDDFNATYPHDPCPYGKVGDRLWVRETFYPMPHLNAKAYLRATDPLVGVSKWHPSIYMPRWASRITLEIVSVRIERLMDISEGDAYAEGCERLELSPSSMQIDGETIPIHPMTSTYKQSFAHLWDTIHGVDSFVSDPFVWVIEFRRVQP